MRFSRIAGWAGRVLRLREGNWGAARRERAAVLGFLVPLLSTHPVLVTQIVDRKNADEWALVLAVLACAGVAYVSRSQTRARAKKEGLELPERVAAAARTIRSAVRSQLVAAVMVPLSLSSPWAASEVVVRHNVDLWQCFFGLVAAVELWRAARIWKESRREVEKQLAGLVEQYRSSRPAERYGLELTLGRRMYARLERLALYGSSAGEGLASISSTRAATDSI